MVQKINKNVFLFLIGDFLLFYAALFLALQLRPNSWNAGWESIIIHIVAFLPLFFLYEIVLYTSGLMDRKFVPSRRKIFDLLLRAHLVATLLMFIYFYIANNFLAHTLLADKLVADKLVVDSNAVMIAPQAMLIVFSTLLFVFIYSWKILRKQFFNINPEKALLIGDDKEVEENFGTNYLWGMNVVEKITHNEDLPAIEKILANKQIDSVIVDIDNYPRIDVLYKLVYKQINIYNLAMIKEELSEKIDLKNVNDLWFITNIRSRDGMFDLAIKRFFDLLLAIPVLLIYALAFPVLSYLVKKDGGSIFFDMPRVGLGGKIFHIRKFRSMSPDLEGDKKLVGHTKKVTRIGAFMRKTGLDELPQVMSVIKGDMSFIGPRPEIPTLVEKYTEEIEHYQIRHLVKPGLSGWAQVMQESAPHHTADVDLTREKLAYDLYYIKNHSPFLYFIIVLKTIKSVLNRTNHG
jgi:lipopolysaccharide/colanic/teichoic acid biosynthesis glycosyltransferase